MLGLCDANELPNGEYTVKIEYKHQDIVLHAKPIKVQLGLILEPAKEKRPTLDEVRAKYAKQPSKVLAIAEPIEVKRSPI